MEGPPTTSSIRTAKTVQQLSFNNESPQPVQPASLTPPVDVQTLADGLCSERTDLTRLLERSSQKVQPKTAFTSYHTRDQSLAEGKVPILVSTALDTVPSHLTPQKLVFGQVEVLRLFQRAFFRLLIYRYYRLVNARIKRQQHKTSQAHRLIKDLKMSVTTFDGTSQITILQFLSIIVEECNLQQTSETYACPVIPTFLKRRSLDHLLAIRNSSSFSKLPSWLEYVNFL